MCRDILFREGFKKFLIMFRADGNTRPNETIQLQHDGEVVVALDANRLVGYIRMLLAEENTNG